MQEPAKVAGLRFQDDRLIERIVNDAIEAAPSEEGDRIARSTVLPLLEYALTRLWEQRHPDRMLTHEAYEGIGGLTGGLTLWADQAYRGLGRELQPLGRRVLIDLVEPGDEGQETVSPRRSRPLAELYRNESESEAVQRVVQRLTEARLLVTIGDRQSEQEYVEIIHDALRDWNRLRRWLREENRRYLAWRQEIEKRAQNWSGSNPEDPTQRNEDELLRACADRLATFHICWFSER